MGSSPRLLKIDVCLLDFGSVAGCLPLPPVASAASRRLPLPLVSFASRLCVASSISAPWPIASRCLRCFCLPLVPVASLSARWPVASRCLPLLLYPADVCLLDLGRSNFQDLPPSPCFLFHFVILSSPGLSRALLLSLSLSRKRERERGREEGEGGRILSSPGLTWALFLSLLLVYSKEGRRRSAAALLHPHPCPHPLFLLHPILSSYLRKRNREREGGGRRMEDPELLLSLVKH